MDVGESQKNVTDVGKSHNYCTINQKEKKKALLLKKFCVQLLQTLAKV